ncbi:MAG: glycoside hydrolase family 32 protein [Cyclobacteriaceae bacterium]
MITRFIYFSILITIITGCSTPKESMPSKNENYREKHRLQFHFSPATSWMNDPNGLVYHNGEYHMFYQYYPDSTVWGPMHWGHAVSKDLVHWQHLPTALFPDSLGYIFSGSAVVDSNNTSGFGKDGQVPLVAIYTYHQPDMEREGSIVFQTQGIAYSLDNGRTWTKYDGNPILPNPGIRDFRDPKVFWLESQQKWVMSLAVKDHISFYSSSDFKNWKFESDFGTELGAHGGVWECPDLFLLGDKWILLVSINPGGPNGGSATQYFVGDFDGSVFTPIDTAIRWLDYGRDNYAGVTWSNITDGRRIFIGWMSNWDYGNLVPTDPWRSAMTLPRTLSLEKIGNEYVVSSKPVVEVEQLRTQELKISSSSDLEIALNPSGENLYEIDLSIEGKTQIEPFKIILSNEQKQQLIVAYDPHNKQFTIDRDSSGDNSFSEKFNGIQEGPFDKTTAIMKLRLIVDVGSVELFVDDGALTMTSLFFPDAPLTQAKFVQESGNTVAGSNYTLQRSWD